ncbi:cytochrome-c oxidase, cbb3-type subunit III [uncultured Roseobacter sp.]|uniref:cytochrome-c oxidase, cbb3-type subunit III n=1 Tax=uncultured Roseobacter sp. TaxID=114847 RepID=UPI0026224C83|nr:cytochrome-c oxidase, cbb3-type subunit III [uncultured Roseobacter sp.]
MTEPKEKTPETTDHEWDGITEFRNPVPRIFKLSYILTILISVLMWVLLPSWPGVRDIWPGVLGYSSRTTVLEGVEEAKALRQQASAQAGARPLGSILFADNCAACHGYDLAGQTGFPNLIDAAWLWSGTREEIIATIRYGINTDHPDTRYSEMPAFGRDGMLPRAELEAISDYVASLSGPAPDHESAAAVAFDENCSACHGARGSGIAGSGVPVLDDAHWIYGGGTDAILETLHAGRQGVMPAWESRLNDRQIEELADYLIGAADAQGS